MTTFPTIVYKEFGTYQRPGGTFSYAPAKNQEEFDILLSAGWFATLQEAVDGKSKVTEVIDGENQKTVPGEEVSEDTLPTRQEIETKCKELGIKVHGRSKDETLLKKIEEKLSELDEETTSQ